MCVHVGHDSAGLSRKRTENSLGISLRAVRTLRLIKLMKLARGSRLFKVRACNSRDSIQTASLSGYY